MCTAFWFLLINTHQCCFPGFLELLHVKANKCVCDILCTQHLSTLKELLEHMCMVSLCTIVPAAATILYCTSVYAIYVWQCRYPCKTWEFVCSQVHKIPSLCLTASEYSLRIPLDCLACNWPIRAYWMHEENKWQLLC